MSDEELDDSVVKPPSFLAGYSNFDFGARNDMVRMSHDLPSHKKRQDLLASNRDATATTRHTNYEKSAYRAEDNRQSQPLPLGRQQIEECLEDDSFGQPRVHVVFES